MKKNRLFLVLSVLFFVSAVSSFGYTFVKLAVPAFGRYDFVDFSASVVGMTVGVPSNPANTLAEQLKDKENVLLGKERALAEREAVVSEQLSSDRKRDTTFIYLYGVNGTLLFLILLNFYFDYERRRHLTLSQTP
jgi:hypothetical protein